MLLYSNNKYNNYRRRKSSFRLLMVCVLVSILILGLAITPVHAYSELSNSAVYDHLMSQTYEYSDASTPAARTFESWAGAILRVVLPFMTIFGMTNMIISGAASVIYLSNPPFFDEVHYMHYMRRKKKTAGNSASKMKEWLQTLNELGLKDGLIKGMIIPDVKARAFYDALEIGEDGRPSVVTFIKNSFPKYMVLMALILMISDRTLMNLYVKGGEVGLWFFKKAESYNYIASLERAANSGSKYDPGFKGGKKAIYKACENILLSLDKSPGTESAQYKQGVGNELAAWLTEKGGALEVIDFESNRVSPSAIASMNMPSGATLGTDGKIASMKDGSSITFISDVSRFGVKPANDEKYLILRVDVNEKRNTVSQRLSFTTDPVAISLSGDTLVFTLEKTGKFDSEAKITGISAVRSYGQRFSVTSSIGSGGKTATFNVSGLAQDKRGTLWGVGANIEISTKTGSKVYQFFYNSQDGSTGGANP